MGENIATKRGRKFALEVLDFMRERLVKYQEETGNIYNLEATPAESTAYRLALKDKEKYPDIITAGTKKVPYYTNSTQLPVNYTDDVFEALKLQDEIQCKYTGGCIEKGNKVLTDKGLLPIEYIFENFEKLKPIRALSYNKEKEISEWDEIVKAVKIDVSKENKIRIKGERNLDIVTSDWHPFFVLEKIKPNPSCPVCGTEVINIKGFATHLRWSLECREEYKKIPKYRIVEKRADELKVGDYILQNFTNVYPQKESELNNDLMWLIGFFIGDGCISKFVDNRGGNNLKKYKVRFFSKSQEALEKVAKILNKYFGCNVKVIKNDKRSDQLREVSTSKKEVLEFFFKYGFWAGEKVYNIYVPQKVKENFTQESVYAFLSGLMDSDGSLDKRDGDFEYETVSSQLAEDLLEIFTKAGIMVSKILKKTKRKNENDIWRIRISQYELTKIKEKLCITVNPERIKPTLSNRKKRQLPVVRVKEVSKVDVKDNQFYDLMTRKNHNYLAGKDCLVFVHNTVLHIFLGERMQSGEGVKKLVKKVFENFKLPYITITPTFSICPVHGYLEGEHFFCPKCIVKQPCEVYSRIVGYLRPVQQWNLGKQQEFHQRKVFKISEKEL
jgi:ribonucleoside-triphosphate reductase